MPKMKTHSGAKKTFRVTGSGKIMHERAGKRHLLERKSSRVTRRLSTEQSAKPTVNQSSSNQTKFRSPSTNQTPAKPRASTINRYKDVHLESQEDDSHMKNKERLSIGNGASKLNSTIKKRPEVTINTNTITFSSKTKK